MRDHMGSLIAAIRSQITSNWQSLASCVTTRSASIFLYVVKNQLSKARSDSNFVALMFLWLANVSVSFIGQFCVDGRVKAQKCLVNGGLGGCLSIANFWLTNIAIITTSFICFVGCNAVRTKSVTTERGGGGGSAFDSTKTLIDHGVLQVIARLHQVDCCTLLML